MAKLLEMPKLSPTMEEGVLSAWHKNEGDAIEVDDLLAEVETDKATMEFRAFDKGTLLKVLVAPGANVKLGDPVAIVGNVGDDVSALLAKASTGAAAAPAATAAAATAATEGRGPDTQLTGKPAANATAPAAPTAPALPTLVPPTQAAQGTARSPQAATPGGSVLTRTERAPFAAAGGGGAGLSLAATESNATNGGRVLASPFVRKTARDRGLDLAGAHGSGPGGRVLPADLDQIAGSARRASDGGATATATATALARSTPTAPTAPGAAKGLSAPEVRPLSPMRKTIARRLSESKRTVPHFYLTIDVDASKLVELRERINQELAADAKAGEESKPFKVSVNDLLLKAVAGALARVPECNAQFTDEAILIHTRIDVSVAVAVPEGLVTPVVRNADRKSVVAIAREVRELATRARAKKLKPEEMSDGTFSVSNLGMFGIDEFSAVINPPEGAILAIGQVREVPVVENGAVVPGKRLSMTLSCDHRVIDGAVGASFLAELRALVERPMRVLTG